MPTADHHDERRDLEAARIRRDATATEGDSALQRFLDEVLAAEAGARRNRSRWLYQRAVEEARLVGVLRDLGERGANVVVTTVVGTTHRGTIMAVGKDFVVVATPAPGSHLIAVRALTGVRTAPGTGGGPAAMGRRGHAHDVALQEVLSGIAPERPDVIAYTAAEPGGISGRLVAAGEDVVTIRLGAGEEAPSSHLHLPAHALAAITITT